MSAYPRRGINVSQFLASGNTISPTEASSSSIHGDNANPEDEFANFQDDLAKYTNLGEFKEIDFHAPASVYGGHEGVDFSVSLSEQEHGSKRFKTEKSRAAAAAAALQQQQQQQQQDEGHEFGSDYPFNPFDFPNSPPPGLANNATAAAPYATAYPGGILPPPPPTPLGSNYPHPTHHPLTTTSPPSFHPTHHHHHQPSELSSPTETTETRHAAEEDKRRRNTAASARFRVKKKEREKALEKNADELKKRNTDLEIQVEALRKENVWLKELVVGRRDALKDGDGEGEVDVEGEERILGGKKKGVGTVNAVMVGEKRKEVGA